MSAKETISIAIQMMAGIQAAHSHHIIHRDIKPQNIIISKDGKVKVTDFGIARATTSTNTISTNVMGSVHYTSPEQARGGIVDEKSDIYSAGITMYEMITGHVPFDGDSTVSVAVKHLKEEMVPPSKEVPGIPYSLECIILKCTQKATSNRYQNCQEVIEDLKHSLVDPNGSFVRVGNSLQDTATVVMSEEELEEVKRRNMQPEPPVKRQGNARRASRNYEEEDYGDDYDRDDYDRDDYDRDDYDDDDYDDDYDTRRERARDRVRRPAERRSGNGKQGKKSGSLDPDTRKIMKILLVVVAAIIVFLFIFLAVKFAGVFKGGSNPSSQTQTEVKVAVPNLINMTEEDAKDALNDKGLGYVVSERRASDKYAKGRIIEQSVDANKKVEKNTEIQVVVSTGEEVKNTYVPNVVDKTEADAEKMLSEKNLIADAEAKYDDNVEEGKVIATEPSAGAEVEEGTHVKVYISLGAEKVDVPNVEGKSQSDAEAALTAAGLKWNVTEDYHDSIAAGNVISQTPKNGEKVKKDTVIELVVSKGAKVEYVTVPPLQNLTESQAKQKLEAAGLKLGEVNSEPSEEVSAGLVIRQQYASGSQLAKGDAVSIIISSGPSSPPEDKPSDEPSAE